MRSRNLFIETETFANIIDTTVERTSLLSFHFHVGVLLKCAVGQCVNFFLAPIKAPLISLYCCFLISFYSCGSLIVDLAVKFTSIVTEDWVLSAFRNAIKSKKLGEFFVNTTSVVGIAPVSRRTTKPSLSKTAPTPDGMYMYLTKTKIRPIHRLGSAQEFASFFIHSTIYSRIFVGMKGRISSAFGRNLPLNKMIPSEQH